MRREPRVEPKGPMVSATMNAAGALDREQLLQRLDRLRAILPAFAEELAVSRRQAAALRVENRGLLAEVRRLQHQGEMQRQGESQHQGDSQRQSAVGGPSRAPVNMPSYAPVNIGRRPVRGGC